jgi:hypothetical protein
MELMDLPPEMLAEVVARYVTMDATETGFRDAWKARLICSEYTPSALRGSLLHRVRSASATSSSPLAAACTVRRRVAHVE